MKETDVTSLRLTPFWPLSLYGPSSENVITFTSQYHRTWPSSPSPPVLLRPLFTYLYSRMNPHLSPSKTLTYTLTPSPSSVITGGSKTKPVECPTIRSSDSLLVPRLNVSFPPQSKTWTTQFHWHTIDTLLQVFSNIDTETLGPLSRHYPYSQIIQYRISLVSFFFYNLTSLLERLYHVVLSVVVKNK